MNSESTVELWSSFVKKTELLPDFDPNVTFVDGSRLINHPLDEVYLSPPGDFIAYGMLPRAEHQIRAAMIEMLFCTKAYMTFGFFKSLFERDEYKRVRSLALDKQKAFREMINSSAEHKAAIKRVFGSLGVEYQYLIDLSLRSNDD